MLANSKYATVDRLRRILLLAKGTGENLSTSARVHYWVPFPGILRLR